MAIIEKLGFVRKQEVAFAKKLLIWKYEKAGLALPEDEIISAHAEKVVEDAHRIAKQSGRNLLEIIKNTAKDFKKKT